MNILRFLIASLLLWSFLSGETTSASTAYLKNGVESFKVIDPKNQKESPQFRILDDSMTKQSLAIALNSAYKLNGPDAATQAYVDVRIEKIIFKTSPKKPEQISVALLLSGKEVELEKTISKSKFLAGEKITLHFPPKKDAVTLFTVTSKGSLSIQLKPKENKLLIDPLFAQMKIESQMTGAETEEIHFKGHGVRE